MKTEIFGKSVRQMSTINLVTLALFASLGVATKNIIRPLVGMLASPLFIPTGSVAGGVYMMWPVIAYGLTKKVGAATITSLIQAFVSLVMPYGNFGVLSFAIYLAPGLAIDVFFFLTSHRACCAACCIGAAAIANAVGTVLVGALVLALPYVTLLFLVLIASISGCIGGFIANMMLVRIRKMGLGVN